MEEWIWNWWPTLVTVPVTFSTCRPLCRIYFQDPCNWMSPARLRIGGSKICTLHCTAVVPNASVLRHLLLQKPMTLVEGCKVQNHLNKKSQLGKFLGKMLFIEILNSLGGRWADSNDLISFPRFITRRIFGQLDRDVVHILTASRLLLGKCQNYDAFICCCAEHVVCLCKKNYIWEF